MAPVVEGDQQDAQRTNGNQGIDQLVELQVGGEHQQRGGLFAQLLAELRMNLEFSESLSAEAATLGGSRDYLLEMAGLSEKNIANQILALKNRK